MWRKQFLQTTNNIQPKRERNKLSSIYFSARKKIKVCIFILIFFVRNSSIPLCSLITDENGSVFNYLLLIVSKCISKMVVFILFYLLSFCLGKHNTIHSLVFFLLLTSSESERCNALSAPHYLGMQTVQRWTLWTIRRKLKSSISLKV